MIQSINMWQIEVIPGRPDKNTKTIINYLNSTKDWSLTFLPEMAIPGYMIWDMWLRDSFVKESNGYNERVLEVLQAKWSSAVWWNVSYDESKKNNDWSMRKYNSAFIWSNWKLIWVRHKTLLPNYRMFDDKRYFTSLEELAKEENKDLREYYKPVEIEIAWVKYKVWVLICEDIWNINWDYNIDPVELTKSHAMDLLWVISGSPFGLNKDTFRKKLLQRHSDWTNLVYVNPIWTQDIWKTIHAFDWWSAIYKDWEFVRWIKDFTTNHVIETLTQKNEMEQVYETLIFSIRQFFERMWFTKVVIWLSWWIDSWVVATLMPLALWKENVVAVNMPSKFNSETTKDLAKDLADKLWIEYLVYPIQEIVDMKVKQLEETTWKKATSFDIENIQARVRWQTLSDISANLWAVFTCNWNKDEFALWYWTLYWDIAWAIAPIWDLYKFQVFDLARHINERFNQEVIPSKMINLKPSAELSAKQNPEEWWWDPFDYQFTWRLNRWYIEKKFIPTDILRFYKEWVLEEKLWLEEKVSSFFETKELFIQEVEKLWKLLHKNYFKRVQAPPIIQLGKWSFWFDYREAQIDAYFGHEYERLKLDILTNN